MRKFFGAISFFVLATAALGQGYSPFASTAIQNECLAGTGGVTAGKLLKVDPSNPVSGCVTATTTDTQVIGISLGTSVSGGFLYYISMGNQASGVVDNTTVAGDLLTISTTSNGELHDTGQSSFSSIPQSTLVLGRALQAATSGTTVPMQLFAAGLYGTGAANNLGGLVQPDNVTTTSVGSGAGSSPEIFSATGATSVNGFVSPVVGQAAEECEFFTYPYAGCTMQGTNPSQLAIINYSTPIPTPVTTLNIACQYANGITPSFDGNYAYISCYDGGNGYVVSLGAYGHTGSGSLAVVGTVSGLGVSYGRNALIGTYWIVPDFNGRICMVSLATPTSPGAPVCTSTGVPSGNNPVAVSNFGTEIYVAMPIETGQSYVASYLFSSGTLTYQGAVAVDHSPQDVAAYGTVAYVPGFDSAELSVLNFANPYAPVLSENLASPCGSMKNVQQQSGLLYANCYNTGKVAIYDIGSGSNSYFYPNLISVFTVEGAGNMQNIVVQNRQMLATDYPSSGKVYSVYLSPAPTSTPPPFFYTTTTPNSLTFNNSGTGAASGTTFNGATAQTISYNTVGAGGLSGNNIWIYTNTWLAPSYFGYNDFVLMNDNPAHTILNVSAGQSDNVTLFLPDTNGTLCANTGVGCPPFTTPNALTGAASGGASPGATFNGSAAVTFDYHTLGAGGLAVSNTWTANQTIQKNGDSINLKYGVDSGSQLIAWTNSSGIDLWKMGGGICYQQNELCILNGSTQIVNFLPSVANFSIPISVPSGSQEDGSPICTQADGCPASSIAIGTPITGGANGKVLIENSDSNLDETTWDGTPLLTLGGAVTADNFSINQTCAGGVGTGVTPATITGVAGTDSNHTLVFTFGSGTVAPSGNCVLFTMTYTNAKNRVSFPNVGSLVNLSQQQVDAVCAFAGDCTTTSYSVRVLQNGIPSGTQIYPQVFAP